MKIDLGVRCREGVKPAVSDCPKKLTITSSVEPSVAVVAEDVYEKHTKSSLAKTVNGGNVQACVATPSATGTSQSDSHCQLEVTSTGTETQTLRVSLPEPLHQLSSCPTELTSLAQEMVSTTSNTQSEPISLGYFAPNYMFKEHNLRRVKKPGKLHGTKHGRSPEKAGELMPETKRLKVTAEPKESVQVTHGVTKLNKYCESTATVQRPLLREPDTGIDDCLVRSGQPVDTRMWPAGSEEDSELKESQEKPKTVMKRKFPTKRKKKGTDVSQQKGVSLAARTIKCSLCSLGANVSGLGFLYGPYKNSTVTSQQLVDATDPDEVSSVIKPTPLDTWVHEDCTAWAPGICLDGNKLVGLEEAIRDAEDMVC